MEEREKAKNQEEKLVPTKGKRIPFKGLPDLPVMGIRDPWPELPVGGRKFRWHTANGRKLRSEKLKKRIMAGTSGSGRKFRPAWLQRSSDR